MNGGPEIPLQEFVNSCAVDALIVNLNREPKPEVWTRTLEFNFIGKLAEAAFAEWTGIPRKRPKLGEFRDHGDVDLGGSVKGAADYRETPGRNDQNWSINAGETTRGKYVVFVSVELARSFGPPSPFHLRLAGREPLLGRWLQDGRIREPVATIRGWLPEPEVEALRTEENVQDGVRRPPGGYRLVNWRKLRPWPEHPHPTYPAAILDLLGLRATEEERAAYLEAMRRGVPPPEGP